MRECPEERSAGGMPPRRLLVVRAASLLLATVLHLPILVGCLVAMAAPAAAADVVPAGWRPSPGHIQIPIWPNAAPDQPSMPGQETVKKGWVTNVARPTMSVYAPRGRATRAAVVVFPGGGFQGLAIDLEGTEICNWLTSKGLTCVLLKYRVLEEQPPEQP